MWLLSFRGFRLDFITHNCEENWKKIIYNWTVEKSYDIYIFQWMSVKQSFVFRNWFMEHKQRSEGEIWTKSLEIIERERENFPLIFFFSVQSNSGCLYYINMIMHMAQILKFNRLIWKCFYFPVERLRCNFFVQTFGKLFIRNI